MSVKAKCVDVMSVKTKHVDLMSVKTKRVNLIFIKKNIIDLIFKISFIDLLSQLFISIFNYEFYWLV